MSRLTNLRLCFPVMDDAERERLVRRHFAALGRGFRTRSALVGCAGKAASAGEYRGAGTSSTLGGTSGDSFGATLRRSGHQAG